MELDGSAGRPTHAIRLALCQFAADHGGGRANRKNWASSTIFHAQVVRLALVQLRIDDGEVKKRLRVGEHALDHRPDACAKWQFAPQLRQTRQQTNSCVLGSREPELTLRADDLERDLAAIDVRLSLAALHRQHHQKSENTVAMVLWRNKDPYVSDCAPAARGRWRERARRSAHPVQMGDEYLVDLLKGEAVMDEAQLCALTWYIVPKPVIARCKARSAAVESGQAVHYRSQAATGDRWGSECTVTLRCGSRWALLTTCPGSEPAPLHTPPTSR